MNTYNLADSFDFIIGRNCYEPAVIALYKIVPTDISAHTYKAGDTNKEEKSTKFRVKNAMTYEFIDGFFDTKEDAMLTALSHDVRKYNDCTLRIFSKEDFAFKMIDSANNISKDPKSIECDISTDSRSRNHYLAILKVEKAGDITYYGIVKQNVKNSHKYCILDLYFEDIVDGLDTVDETINLFIENIVKESISKPGDYVCVTRIE